MIPAADQILVAATVKSQLSETELKVGQSGGWTMDQGYSKWEVIQWAAMGIGLLVLMVVFAKIT